jgi:hypothetical protein
VTVEADLDHLAEVVSVRFLYYKVILFPLFNIVLVGRNLPNADHTWGVGNYVSLHKGRIST